MLIHRHRLLPSGFAPLLLAFAPLFRSCVWERAQLLLLGAILAPGQRTVCSVLRIVGLGSETHFQNYHRVLNRARWSSRAASRILLGLLLQAFARSGPLLVGLDDTIERRWGRKIQARGIDRDPVRSSHSHFVKTSGLRWLSLMLLVEIPWAGRVWALPFFTVLAPSERYHQKRHKRHKTLVNWGRQMILQLRRWLPERPMVLVVDSGYAALEFLGCLANQKQAITCITRLRLDAQLYAPAPPRRKGQTGRPRRKGVRLASLQQRLRDRKTRWSKGTVPHWYSAGPRTIQMATGTAVWYRVGLPVVPLRWILIRDPQGTFRPQALLSTDREVAPGQAVQWFVQRWQRETTFAEVRAKLGVESQRQGSDPAIARTTPCLLALFSLIPLWASDLHQRGKLSLRQWAWYRKPQLTFSDTIAAVRQQLWSGSLFAGSLRKQDPVEIPRVLLQHLTEALCYAA
jgi:DDE superfamily endonuclease